MKVLIVCNGGMSSSILMKKTKEAAQKRNIDLDIAARPNSNLKNEIGKWDVCLVGPQIMYAVDSIQQTLGIPVASVETLTYALADGDKALDQAMKLMK